MVAGDDHMSMGVSNKDSELYKITPTELVAKSLKRLLENGQEPIPTAAQHPFDIIVWNEFLYEYKPDSILELGTGTGAFSKWLKEKVTWFETIDDYSWHKKDNIPIEKFGLDFDIFAYHDIVRDIIKDAPRSFVLFCDNGDKPREVREFSPYLVVGDYLAVHDFCIEIKKEDIPNNFKLIKNIGLTAFYIKESE